MVGIRNRSLVAAAPPPALACEADGDVVQEPRTTYSEIYAHAEVFAKDDEIVFHQAIIHDLVHHGTVFVPVVMYT